MSKIRLSEIGRKGIVSDKASDLLDPKEWSDGNNIRFTEGRIIKMGGETEIWASPTVAPHGLMPWNAASGYLWLYGSTATIYMVNSSGTHTNVTRYTSSPGDDDYTAGTRPIWSGGVFNGVPILNHNNLTDPPQSWNSGNSRFEDLPNWPASTYTKIIRPFKNYLIAVDVTKSGTRYPYTVKWSDQADPGSVPGSWDETDATVEAGENSLAETGGYILDCLPVGDTNIIYKEDAIWSMQYIGGAYIFRFDGILNTTGILAPRCVAEFYRRHFVVGTNDVFLFNGQQAESVINERMRRWLYNTIHGDYYLNTFVVPNYVAKEMWICFVETGHATTYCNKALIWNWSDNTWTIRDLDDMAHINYGQVATSTAAAISFDSSSGTTFDNDTGTFGEGALNPAEWQLVGADPAGTRLLHIDDDYTFDGTSYDSYMERTGISFTGQLDQYGNPLSDGSVRKFLRAIYPHIEITGDVTFDIYVGWQDRLEDSITWTGPYTYDPATQDRVDCRVNGKYFAIKFVESSNTHPWRMSGYTVDIDSIGLR